MDKKKILLLAASVITLLLLVLMVGSVGNPSGNAASQTAGSMMDKYDMYMTNAISEALNDVLAIEKVYWLSDEDLVAPEPDQSKFGTANSVEEMLPILKEAEALMEGQQLHFGEGIPLMAGEPIRYYLDETIFAVTWKEEYHSTVYTFAEVKIADPSQLRRFLAGGEYGSEKQFVTTEMSESVNAVLASSGDFYRFRSQGIIVYNGKVQRVDTYKVDTCMIDDKGDLHFVKAGQFRDVPSAQAYVDENNIRFSLAFGPILIDNGKRCEPDDYYLGEVKDFFPRSALCQLGDCHYMLAIGSEQGEYKYNPTIHMFAEYLTNKKQIQKAYALDGGQTAVIAMNHELVNSVFYGYQREISDIIYFATAVPNGG